MPKETTDTKALLMKNADVLTSIAVDAHVSEALRVKVLSKLLDERESLSFYDTLFDEKLDFGACPECGFETHWLVPEVDLNQRGYVSADKDPRVKRTTTHKDCREFEQACSKKKVFP